jgi:hypothetical protein
MIDFAVFVGGVFYVVRRLAAFLTAVCVILIAFTQMFYTVFQQSDYCRLQPEESQEEIDLSTSSSRDMHTLAKRFFNRLI